MFHQDHTKVEDFMTYISPGSHNLIVLFLSCCLFVPSHPMPSISYVLSGNASYKGPSVKSALRPPPRRKMKNPPFFREKGRRFIFRPVSALFPGKRAEISFSALRKSKTKSGPPQKIGPPPKKKKQKTKQQQQKNYDPPTTNVY